jgi:hypothetical protein
VIGIVSTNPAVIGNAPDDEERGADYALVALLGQIPARVSAENGAIRPGDSLTSASSTPGYIMKAEAGDSTVGIALQSLNEGQGTIQILISRRNKSLSVEQVEEQVTKRVADMKIEDEVDIMIADALKLLGVDEQLKQITLKVADLESNLQLAVETIDQLQTTQIKADSLSVTGEAQILGTTTFGGNVGIGTTTPNTLLHIGSPAITDGSLMTIQDSNGTCTLNPGSGAAWSCTSDINLKHDIALIDEGLSPILKLKPSTFKINIDDSSGVGFIAQEVQEVFPSLVSELSDGTLMVAEGGMMPYVVKAIQEQENNINEIIDRLGLVKNAETVQGTSTDISLALEDIVVLNRPLTLNFDLMVKGHAYFNQDAVGQAKIIKGATAVEVIFDKEYEYLPIVTATKMGPIKGDYWVATSTATGFFIILDQPQEHDLVFNWHAFSSPEAKLFVSDGTVVEAQLTISDDQLATDNSEIISKEPTAETMAENQPTTGLPIVESSAGGQVAGEATETNASSTEPVVENQPIAEEEISLLVITGSLSNETVTVSEDATLAPELATSGAPVEVAPIVPAPPPILEMMVSDSPAIE